MISNPGSLFGRGKPKAPLRIIGNLTRINYAADTIASSATQLRESRLPHYTGGADLSEIWLVYGNYWCDIGAGGRETNTGNAVNVAASLLFNSIAVQAPNANTTTYATMTDGQSVFLAGPFYPSSFGLTKFTKNTQFFSQTSMYANVGQNLPRTGQYGSEAPAYRNQTTVGNSQIGLATAWTANNTNAPGPIAIIGRSITPELAVLSVGDSINEGQADNSQYPSALLGGGYSLRGLYSVNGRKVPVAHVGRHGGSISAYMLHGDARRALYKYATHVHIAFGANDLFYNSGVNAYTTFMASLNTEIATIRAAGAKFIIVSLVGPRTQSNDSFMTLASQLQQGVPPGPGVTGYWDPVAIEANVHVPIRALKGVTIDDYFDTNIYWGDSGGNSAWVTNGTAFYPVTNGDGTGASGGAYLSGTHPTPALHTLAGTGFATKAATWTAYR